MKTIKRVVESGNDFLDAEYTYFRWLPLNIKVAYFYSDFYNGKAYKTKTQAVQVIKNLCKAFGYETIPFLPLTVEEILKYHKLTMEEFEERVDKQFEGEITPATIFYFRAEEEEFFYIGEHAADIFDELLDEFFAVVYVPGVSKEFLRQVFDHLYIEFKTPGETNDLEWANESLTQILNDVDSETLVEIIERDFDKIPHDILHTFREALYNDDLIFDILYYYPFKPEEVASYLEDLYLQPSDYYFTDSSANLDSYNGTIETFYRDYAKYVKDATLSDINDLLQNNEDTLRPLLIPLIEAVDAQSQENLDWAHETAGSPYSAFTIDDFNKKHTTARYEILQHILKSLSGKEILSYQKEISGKDVENLYDIKAQMPIKITSLEEIEYFFGGLPEDFLSDEEITDNTYIVFESYGFGTYDGDIESFYSAQYTIPHIIYSLVYYFSHVDDTVENYITAKQIELDFDKLMQLDSPSHKEDLSWVNETASFETFNIANMLLDTLIQLDDFDSYLYICEVLSEYTHTGTFSFLSKEDVRDELRDIREKIRTFNSSDNPPTWIANNLPYYTRVIEWLGDKKLYDDNVYNIHTLTSIDSNADFEDYFREHLDKIAAILEKAVEKNGPEGLIKKIERWDYFPSIREPFIEMIQQFYLQTEDLSWVNESIKTDDTIMDSYIEEWLIRLARDLHPVGLSELFRDLYSIVSKAKTEEDKIVESGMIFYNDTDNFFGDYTNLTGKEIVEKYIRIDFDTDTIIEVIDTDIYEWFKKNIKTYVRIVKLIAARSNGDIGMLSTEIRYHSATPQQIIDDFARIVNFYSGPQDDIEVAWANESIRLNNKKKKEVNMITTQVGKIKIKNGKAIVESKVTTVNKGKPLPKITKADPRKSDKAQPKASSTKASLATTLENAKTQREFMNAGMEALGSALNTRKLLLSLWAAMKEQKPGAKELNNTLEGALKVKDSEKEAPKRELPKQRRRLEGPRVKKIEKTVKFSK